MTGALSVITTLSSSISSPTPTLYYDPSVTASYPGTGNLLYNAGNGGTMTGTSSNIQYVSTGPKYLNMIGVPGISFPAYNFGTFFTTSIWLNAGSGSSCQAWMANGNSGPTAGFRFFWNSWTTNDHYLCLEGGNGTSAGGDNSGVAVIVPGTWQYITYVWNVSGRAYSMYNNGELVRTGASTTPFDTVVSGRAWTIGEMADSSYHMAGWIGYIKLWRNTLLSQTQIRGDFNASRARFGV